MAKRGRPAGSDSAATRLRIIDAARIEFANKGFGAAAITAMASSADLAPSAIYHYFGGKSALYEAVFEATVEGIWSDIGGAALGHDTLRESMAQMLKGTDGLVDGRPHYSDFLAMVPIEARLRPEFSHLMDRRSKYQDETFGALAKLGIETGEIQGFTRSAATEVLRSLVMGWFFESHFRGGPMPKSRKAVLAAVEALGRKA